ncbi:LysR substrate-binding domain-containing protein [Reichenbachiella sp. MALMAid0571]|uniref:hydrogen peroxide-inducible genes activator n=1 Tax=Reichenbachiella sp. MALMAid0571 TaxID=3143939 RepID=UPI0032DFF440
MTLVQLEYIVALDTYRHFALAAENCFVTQPTLSMQIQKLEDALGVTLFDREKHPVKPTLIGTKIIEQARNILNESKKIKEIIDDEKNEVSGNITIGVIPTLAPYVIPLFISSFVEKNPKINIQITEQVSDSLINMLKNDQIDIALIVTPVNDESLVAHPIFYEEFFVYTSHHHKMYAQGEIDPATLKTDGLWILNEGHCFRNQTLDICNVKEPNSFESRVKYESGSLETLKKLVDRQGGFTLLPELVTFDLDKNDKTKLRKFQKPVPTREVSLLVKKSFLKQKIVKALHAEILKNLPPTFVSQKKSKVINVK